MERRGGSPTGGMGTSPAPPATPELRGGSIAPKGRSIALNCAGVDRPCHDASVMSRYSREAMRSAIRHRNLLATVDRMGVQ